MYTGENVCFTVSDLLEEMSSFFKLYEDWVD